MFKPISKLKIAKYQHMLKEAATPEALSFLNDLPMSYLLFDTTAYHIHVDGTTDVDQLALFALKEPESYLFFKRSMSANIKSSLSLVKIEPSLQSVPEIMGSFINDRPDIVACVEDFKRWRLASFFEEQLPKRTHQSKHRKTRI